MLHLAYCDCCDLLLLQATVFITSKRGTSDAADAINAHIALRRQSRKTVYNVHTFEKKLSSDNERAKSDFSKTRN
jgi:hypothetical protein